MDTIIAIANAIGSTFNTGKFVLDQYTGAAAGYSLRRLSVNITNVVRVRRSSDNAEADFTAAEVADGIMTAWVNTEYETVTNGEFTTDSGWSKGTGWSIANGKASSDGTQTNISYLFQSSKMGASQSQRVTLVVSDYVAGTVRVRLGNSAPNSSITPAVSSNGTHVFTLPSHTDPSPLFIEADANFQGSIESISVVQLTSDGYVTTWYDQAGSNDATQGTAANQPKIVDAGLLVEENGKPAVDFDGVNDYLLGSQLDFDNEFIVSTTKATTLGRMLNARYNGNLVVMITNGLYRRDTNIAYNGPFYDIKLNQQTLLSGLNQTTLYQDGALVTNTNSVGIGYGATDGLFIGIRADLTNQWQGAMQELILYTSDQSSNRVGIETNINNYYAIYAGSPVGGLLYDYPSSAAAYSLRQLTIYNNGYKETLVRVRRDSDNAEVDVKADTNYEISLNSLTSDGVSLGAWIGSDNGFVTTWYDQSGNSNDATQATAANQPKIVNAGSLITSNGYTVIEYDGTDDNLTTSLTATGTMLMGGSDGSDFYEVAISGSYSLLASASLTDHPLNESIRVIWGSSLTTAQKTAIESLVTYTDWDFSDVTSFVTYWRARSELTDFPLIDTSSGTTFTNAWVGCNSLTSFPLLNVSNGINFQNAWFQCSSLTSFPALDLSNGTNFSSAWYQCTSLTSFPLLDVSNGTNFTFAWQQCSSLTSFPLLNVSSGTNFTQAWQQCSSLTSFPLLNVSSGTNFTQAWYQCTSLTSFPLLDVSNGTNFTFAWYQCTSLTSFPQLDVSNGTIFSGAWRSCTLLTSFPLLDVSNGTSFSEAWRDCTSLTSFPLLDVSSGTNFSGAWRQCSSLTSFPLLDVSSGTIFVGTWYQCTSLQDFPANMFDGVTATDFTNAFTSTNLSSQSIENIVVSIDTAGQSNGTLNITGGGNATTATAQTAVDNLRGRGWTVTVPDGY